MVHVTLPHPIQGSFVISGLALAMINLSPKFEVSTKGDTIIAKIGWFGVARGNSRSLEIVPFIECIRVPISVP